MRVLVTRPIEDGEKIARRLAALGHEALLAPLLEVEFLKNALDMKGVQAVLVTSANGVRALAGSTPRRDIPLFAVGPQSAGKARALGFASVQNADGEARALAELVLRALNPVSGLVLHAAGENAGDALLQMLEEKGFHVAQKHLYRMKAAKRLPPEAADALRQDEIDAALFFSPKSAALFVRRARAEDLSASRSIAVCISQNTAEALKDFAFREIRVARAPNQDALLACL